MPAMTFRYGVFPPYPDGKKLGKEVLEFSLRLKADKLLRALKKVCEVCEREGPSNLSAREKQWAHDLCEISEIASAAIAEAQPASASEEEKR